jgi:hypothetical protein
MKKKGTNNDRGIGIIVLILVLAFLLAVGLVLLYVTGTGPQVAGNVRLQQRAFDAAEAGFDEVWRYLNENILSGAILDFSNLYRTDYDGHANVLDDPGLTGSPNPYYFRKLTDEELAADIIKDPTNAIFVNQPLPGDSTLTYSVFLINNEATGVVQNDRDCIIVCIGRAGRNTYARLEVVVEIQTT